MNLSHIFSQNAGRFLIILFTGILLFGCNNTEERPETRVLVFSKTAGFRHASIPQGIAALKALGEKHGFLVDATENAEVFTEDSLSKYSAVVFLNTTGDILNHYQQAFFERYIQAGGGFVGIHSATDTEYKWPWYNKLVGAYFASHPQIQEATLEVIDHGHPSTDSLPDLWQRTDEWYNFRSFYEGINVLINLDETSYEGGENGENHPMAWYHAFDGGRAFYTGSGHTPESYTELAFLNHVLGGIEYAIGDNEILDYGKATREPVPEENRFTATVLDEKLDEPTELAVFNDGRVIFLQRKGEIKMYDPEVGETKTIAKLDVHTEKEDGLMGVALDPDYENNDWIYLYYSPAGDKPVNVLSRFELRGENLVMESEKVLLEVGVQREECCHTGGSLAFGPDGNLFLSTGDNTNPFSSDGYSPSDERAGRSAWDAQKSSGNTNDLRGKILRITPQDDGTYSIPEGNLFAKGDSLSRPEIYVMGNRNPYRISIDQHTGNLYWGEVGPDAGEDSEKRGPRGHDEVNQAQKAGFYGWPYFVGDNKAYRKFDFEDSTSGDYYNAEAPQNLSPNNTGLTQLPPAQSAFIWYPYAESPDFPIVGKGGRNAMAGPVYYSDDYEGAEGSFPEYYDEKLFIYEWMRGWIMAVTMDEEGNLAYIEPFMPSTAFNHPIDMQFGPDGSLYLLEYGTTWFAQNDDARLSRITFNAGNRKPVVMLSADKTVGAAPLTVQFSSEGSLDPDQDDLQYEWSFSANGRVKSNDTNPQFTFPQPGIYRPSLTVTDAQGESTTKVVEIKVGNEPPEVGFQVNGNRSFYWDDTNLDYEVTVKDKEDGTLASGGISPAEVVVTNDYLAQGYDLTELAQGHQTAAAGMLGMRLIEQSDCKSCHDISEKSIGPSYQAVAERYENDNNAVEFLTNKIIQGGGGNWGEQAMAAHPQLSEEAASEMVNYILSLTEEGRNVPTLPVSGTFVADEHQKTEEKGVYIFRAAYTDKGGTQVGPVTGEALLVLRHSLVKAVSADNLVKATVDIDDESGNSYVSVRDGSQLLFKNIDLEGISLISLRGNSRNLGGKIEIRLDSLEGEIIGTATVSQSGTFELPVEIEAQTKQHDLYFIVGNEKEINQPLFEIYEIYFRTAANEGNL